MGPPSAASGGPEVVKWVAPGRRRRASRPDAAYGRTAAEVESGGSVLLRVRWVPGHPERVRERRQRER